MRTVRQYPRKATRLCGEARAARRRITVLFWKLQVVASCRQLSEVVASLAAVENCGTRLADLKLTFLAQGPSDARKLLVSVFSNSQSRTGRWAVGVGTTVVIVVKFQSYLYIFNKKKFKILITSSSLFFKNQLKNMHSPSDAAYIENLYREAAAKELDTEFFCNTSSLSFQVEHLELPTLPHRQLNPQNSTISSQSINFKELTYQNHWDQKQIDPDEFYLPFPSNEKNLVPQSPKSPKSHSNQSSSSSPPGIKPLDPTDDLTAPVITIRSLFVGIVLSVISAAIAQLFQFKPVRVQVSLLTLQILSFLLGTLLSKALPTRYSQLNPGPYSIKEDVFATMMAASAAYAAFGTENFAPQILFLRQSPTYFLSISAQFANQLLAICFAWLFRLFLVNPSQCLYPAIIPSVILFQSFHGGDSLAARRLNLFKKIAPLIGFWEVFPQFLAPAFSAVNAFCLALPASPTVTNLFGGASPNTGFGLFSLSFDWATISAGVNGASPMYVPWIAQVNSWIGLVFAVFLYLSIYKLRMLNSGAEDGYPFLSTELLTQNGKDYNRTAVFKPNGLLNREGVSKEGFPAFTITFVVSQAFAAMLMTSAFSQSVFQNWNLITGIIFPKRNPLTTGSTDPHLKEMQKYPDVPLWFIGCATIAAIALGFLSATLSASQMGIIPMLGAVLLAALVVGSIGFLNATAGFNPVVAPACQMIGGVFGGSVVRSLWFSMFSATCATISLLLIKDIKMMIYTKVPPRKGLLAQISGTVIGVIVNQFVMETIVSKNAAALIEPKAVGQFSGIASQALFNEASTWSLFSTDLYVPGKRYFIIPLFLIIGFFVPIPFLVAEKLWPGCLVGKVNIALVAGTVQVAINGSTSGRMMAIVIGFISQYYLRNYRPRWFSDYNHVLSAALDGGTQLTVLFLSFAIGGGAGLSVNLPHYFLNPAPPLLRDYCTRY
ncbi:hypothetical protein O181_036773 [Austropuccinia psidii MF-1]|uniref:OPT superfamily oligopeptide transporter n=1 Tax=Austropuccinia psidii MF-1 TaxID=1389203 RepID=A0A9Q3D830_9BASI|nr:hypothetical protein [Austropuccinia psidii MF-1]